MPARRRRFPRRPGNPPDRSRITAGITVQPIPHAEECSAMMRAPIVLTLLALAAVAGRAESQTTESKKTLTLEGAKAVAAAAAAEARRGNKGGSIAIVDDGGNLMYLERIAPTFPMGATKGASNTLDLMLP
jgi:hypothetical protein